MRLVKKTRVGGFKLLSEDSWEKVRDEKPMSPIRGGFCSLNLAKVGGENFRDEPTGYKQGTGAESSISNPPGLSADPSCSLPLLHLNWLAFKVG